MNGFMPQIYDKVILLISQNEATRKQNIMPDQRDFTLIIIFSTKALVKRIQNFNEKRTAFVLC